jgi:hypothetical protein
MTNTIQPRHEGHWEDADGCEECGDTDTPTRAIMLRKGRTQRLCEECFETALDAGQVDPKDARVRS